MIFEKNGDYGYKIVEENENKEFGYRLLLYKLCRYENIGWFNELHCVDKEFYRDQSEAVRVGRAWLNNGIINKGQQDELNKNRNKVK